MADTIFALSTASGRAAIAIVRVSGPQAHAAGETLGAAELSAGRAALRRLIDPRDQSPIDEALVLRFDAPSSATGEDAIEFHVHGSRAVVSVLLDALCTLPGCRPAEAGEFTRRAFSNGKLDLTAAEGLADLIDAETAAQRIQAFNQFSGALVTRYEAWREQLLEAMALVESGIDFSDEADVAQGAFDDAKRRVESLGGEIAGHLASANRGEMIRHGFRVALAGVPNAGKSSLINALAARDVAIVSSEAGTTRDVLEVHLDLGGLPIIISDTAGLRESTGEIEREGIRRARERVRHSHLAIWLVDAQAPQAIPHDLVGLRHGDELPSSFDGNGISKTEYETAEFESVEIIPVLNKCDIADREMRTAVPCELEISAEVGTGLEALTDLIVARARQRLSEGALQAPPTTPRHRAHLAACLGQLDRFLASPQDDTELRAEDLRLAASELGRLTGKIDPEDVLGAIFSRFCIGK